MPKILSVYERAAEYEKIGFYIFNKEKMMCKFCNVIVNWKRKDTCEKHCKFRVAHKVNKDRCKASGSGIKRQVTEENLQQQKKAIDEKTKMAIDTVHAFVQANIPLHTLDRPAIREWLNEYIKDSGDLPHAPTQRTSYLQALRMKEEETVKANVKDQNIVVLCDETTKTKRECVIVILFKIVFGNSDPKLVVASVKLLNSANATVCSRAVVETLTKYDIKYDNVCGLFSDFARYMKKCVIERFELTTLNECVVKAKMAFLNTRKKKHHYRKFLKKTSLKPKLFPSPLLTHWNAWFKSVEHLDEYLNIIAEFFKQHNGEGSEATQKAATEAALAAAGQKSYLKSSSMMRGDPAKIFYEEIGYLFNPQSITANAKGIYSATLQAQITALPFLCDVPVHKFMEGYAAIRSSVLETNAMEIDINPISLSLKDYFPDYSENSVKCIWITVSNIDSARAFSMYNNIRTDKDTSLAAGNMEIMLSLCFGSESE
ncbi:hypothetical protein PR048_008049 [Dryococelus australis]|uniref:DUF4371 domain-containing protein n=1 Tax=Dryococelus australis TaxID=614101 RepID=A0ABQ9HVZ3_9NEOP|nr:hypothetical protein PR048_008049 [Dryococelus australis]